MIDLKTIKSKMSFQIYIFFKYNFFFSLGVGIMTRKVGSSVSPVVELTENNGLYTLKTTSPFKNTEIKFKLGEEFEEETVDGRKVKSVCTLDGNKLIQVQKGEKQTTIEREFSSTEMKAVRMEKICKQIRKKKIIFNVIFIF